MDGQRLERFQVDGGDIVVEGAELNVGNLEQFDLITRSAKLNAKLYAKNLNIVTGRNDVQADSLQATPRAADGSESHSWRSTARRWAGCTPGRSAWSAPSRGVGVKLAGDMAASGGDIPHRRQRQAEPGPGLQPGRPEDRGPGRGAERQDLRRWQRRDSQRGGTGQPAEPGGARTHRAGGGAYRQRRGDRSRRRARRAAQRARRPRAAQRHPAQRRQPGGQPRAGSEGEPGAGQPGRQPEGGPSGSTPGTWTTVAASCSPRANCGSRRAAWTTARTACCRAGTAPWSRPVAISTTVAARSSV